LDDSAGYVAKTAAIYQMAKASYADFYLDKAPVACRVNESGEVMLIDSGKKATMFQQKSPLNYFRRPLFLDV